jgi:2-polyprenyl-6-methoxyphenol hydroxylase-like FAD-dependent oxidoreductase
MSGQGTSLALIGAYVLAGELAAASGAYQAAFDQYEKELRPFVMLNQELGMKSASLMKSKERKNPLMWLLEQMLRIAPGRMIQFFYRSTRRISPAANAITPGLFVKNR